MNRLKYIILVLFLVPILTTNCNTTHPIKETIYVPVKDTISEQENIAKIIRLEYELSLYKDSLNYIRDSLGKDLFIANYKLAKIKEYNRLAGNGNNIKFLRGWINRTLNE